MAVRRTLSKQPEMQVAPANWPGCWALDVLRVRIAPLGLANFDAQWKVIERQLEVGSALRDLVRRVGHAERRELLERLMERLVGRLKDLVLDSRTDYTVKGRLMMVVAARGARLTDADARFIADRLREVHGEVPAVYVFGMTAVELNSTQEAHHPEIFRAMVDVIERKEIGPPGVDLQVRETALRYIRRWVHLHDGIDLGVIERRVASARRKPR